MLRLFCLVTACLLSGVACSAQAEVFMPIPDSKAVIALSTRGPSAFRVRLLPSGKGDAIETPMVSPDEADAPFTKAAQTKGNGIHADGLGSALVSAAGELLLLDASGAVLTKSKPLGGKPKNDTCASQPGTDITGGVRAGSASQVKDEAACCAYCKSLTGCKIWIYGHPGDAEGNCWPMASITGTTASSSRTLGGDGAGTGLFLSTSSSAQLYGRGAGKGDATQLTAPSASAFVDNTVVYAPHYYSTDKYAALAVVNQTTGNGKTNVLPVAYSSDSGFITWNFPADAPSFELYLMPAATLDEGTAAYYNLIGKPAVPPRFAFGFVASRWGWQNRTYIEYVLNSFRDGGYPIDAFIGDFGWFTNVSDYSFPSQGFPWYDDFGFSPATFPDPQEQLAEYRQKLNIRMGGIRKPRLGNTALLNEARAKGFLLPGGEAAGKLSYADQRNINFSLPAARDWYAEHEQHYIKDGVTFFWNDEGETDYYTFHWWNMAQLQTLRAVDETRRFYSINRAWSPGMARIGATVWTGDINPSWDDLKSTPGMVLNWGLAGAPYVACDIGGFTSQTTGQLLARWLQVGSFMPTMRVHSTLTATPHFPFLWPEPYRSVMKEALLLRYRLVPYHYSLAHEMHDSGKLWMRPLVAEFPDDATAAPITSQWLDGSLLVSPVLAEDSSWSAYLPAGTWFHFNSSTTEVGPKTLTGTIDLTDIPVFVKTGSVVPLAPVIQFTDALPGGALEVQVYGGADGHFALVEDDGETTDYATGGKVRKTSLAWDDSSSTLSWTVNDGATTSPQMFTQLYVTLFSGGSRKTSATVALDGKSAGSVVVN